MGVKYVRSNGGHLIHVLNGSSTALCGYTPSSPKGRMIRGRGCWANHTDVKPSDAFWCKKCKDRLDAIEKEHR